ncbi:MAG TPA: hypothetical protein VD866_12865 [Urbifossiella sp.]|nr:hypothetical protein [Urbifossiella sp.]
MKIYLAGKVRKNCWRHDVVPALRGAIQPPGNGDCRAGAGHDGVIALPPGFTFPVMPNAIFGAHDYVGPFFVSDDHGCFHGQDTHGMACTEARELVGVCLAAVMRADLVFAWVDALDCYGTVTELGFARGHGKEIVVAGPERYRDMWFLYAMADRTNFRGTDPAVALRHAIDTAGRREVDSRPAGRFDD